MTALRQTELPGSGMAPMAPWLAELPGLRVFRFVATLLLVSSSIFASTSRFDLSHSSLSLAGGTVTAGQYRADVSMDPFGGAAQAAQLNEPARLENDFIEVPSTGGTLAILVTHLLANDPDQAASALSLPEAKTARGGTIGLSNGVITYTPPAVLDVRGDSFAYQLLDSFGTAGQGTVYLHSTEALPRLIDLRREGGAFIVHFRGLPDSRYLLQFRSAFNGRESWSDYPDAREPLLESSDARGDFQFRVSLGVAGAGFFRVADVLSLENELRVQRAGNQIKMTLRGSPNAMYKLQFRESFDAGSVWRDYPPAPRAFSVRSASDGFYQIAVPLAVGRSGFFRTVSI